MKTYLFDTINRYKRFSQQLDVQTVICHRSWWVFNDSGEKEVYIFQPDGTLIISLSGKVTQATWQYIAANESLIISGNNQSYMVHPAFMDRVLFALQIDGTNNVAFLIEEENQALFAPKTYAEIQTYLENKKLAAEREEVRLAKIKRQAEEERNQREQAEEEANQKAFEKERFNEAIVHQIENETIYKIIAKLSDIQLIVIAFAAVLAIVGFIFSIYIYYTDQTSTVETFLQTWLGKDAEDLIFKSMIGFIFLMMVFALPYYLLLDLYVNTRKKKLGYKKKDSDSK